MAAIGATPSSDRVLAKDQTFPKTDFSTHALPEGVNLDNGSGFRIGRATQLVRNLGQQRLRLPRRRRIWVEMRSPNRNFWRAQNERHRSRPCDRDSVLGV